MINIAVDGPSGAGKSTICKLVAKNLKITYLDTGAMFRTVALYALRNNIDVTKEELVEPILKDINISYTETLENKNICLNGEDVSLKIREHHISKAASDISKHQCVREFLLSMQRKIANENDIILDGRDITSIVLPNAKYKFFLTAAPEIRAKRRFDELEAKGVNNLTYEQILKDVIDRDYNDSHRAIAPLVKTEDSILIDSSYMTIDEVVNFIISKIK